MSLDLPYIEHNGVIRQLGGCWPEAHDDDRIPSYGAAADGGVLPRNEWIEIDQEHFNIPIFDQGSTNACVGMGITTAAQYCIKKNRNEVIRLNPYFLYALVNQNRDSGAMISVGVGSASSMGICEQDVCPMHLQYRAALTLPMYKNAKRHRVEVVYRCRNFDEVCSALSRGGFVVFGIRIGHNFANVDSDGVAPLPTDENGGHCMVAMGLKTHKRWGWMPKVHNSWGKGFGMNGFVYLYQEHFNTNLDAYAIMSMIDDPEDNNPEDDVPVAQI